MDQEAGNGRKRILVVNARPDSRTRFLDPLLDRGIEIDYASNGQEAIARCGSIAYKLAIVNLTTTAQRDLFFVEFLKSQQPGLPVLVLADSFSMSDLATAFRCGATDCVRSDAQEHELEARIGRLVR